MPFHLEYAEGGEDKRTGYYVALSGEESDATILADLFDLSDEFYQEIMNKMLEYDSDITKVAEQLGVSCDDVQTALSNIAKQYNE